MKKTKMGNQQTHPECEYVPQPEDAVRYPLLEKFPSEKEWFEHCKSLANDRDNTAFRYVSLQTTGNVKFFFHPNNIKGVFVDHFSAPKAQFEIIPSDDEYCRLRTAKGEYLAVSSMIGSPLVLRSSPRRGSDLFRIEHSPENNFISLYSWVTECYVRPLFGGGTWAVATAVECDES